MKTLNGSLAKAIIWVLLMLVFTTKCCNLFFDYHVYAKLYDIEKTNDEGQTSDSSEDFFKKSGKELFSFFEDDLNGGATSGLIHSSEHWSIYSLTIFKEPLRDVLTPPPNHRSV